MLLDNVHFQVRRVVEFLNPGLISINFWQFSESKCQKFIDIAPTFKMIMCRLLSDGGTWTGRHRVGKVVFSSI